ncbi:MAG TPA: amidohydrolase family protein [Steroidobacteraceae bacterium]|nr:amidohydrolase family protein [Steroidobacteraceae bacterium]
MPAEFADLRIDARWTVPMSAPGVVLEDHSLFVRDGRIDALVPRAQALRLPAPPIVVDRPRHALLPGLIDCHAQAPFAALRGLQPLPGAADARYAQDAAPLAIAEMLTAGVTCFADRSCHPGPVAGAAIAHGMRAVVCAPVAEHATPAGRTLAEHLSAALALHDEYKAHPSISTAFAPVDLDRIGDAALERLKVLADELDTTVVVELQTPSGGLGAAIERLRRLGLLNPALRAIHLTGADAADLRSAAEGGIAVSVCASSALRRGRGLPPLAALRAAGIRLGLGTDGGAWNNDFEPWHELRLAALAAGGGARADDGASVAIDAWDVLAMATRDAAVALRIDAETGTLERGKWADLCCVDALGPAIPNPEGLVEQLVFCGGRDIVSDVWVAGRPLLAQSRAVRFDWSEVRERARRATHRLRDGG